MAWILFGLACLIIIILSIRLFIVSWQHEDLRDENRTLKYENQGLKDDNKYLEDENKYLKKSVQELGVKIIIGEKVLKKKSNSFDIPNLEEQQVVDYDAPIIEGWEVVD